MCTLVSLLDSSTDADTVLNETNKQCYPEPLRTTRELVLYTIQIHGDEQMQTLGSSVGDGAECSQNFFEACVHKVPNLRSIKLPLITELRLRYH